MLHILAEVSKGNFIDTLALTLAQGYVLSAGGPELHLSLPDIFSP